MNKLICPHCQKLGISFLRKMCLGPAVPATCKECGKKVGVPISSMYAAIPFFIAIIGLNFVDSLAFKVILMIVGFIVMSILHMRYVPLERR